MRDADQTISRDLTACIRVRAGIWRQALGVGYDWEVRVGSLLASSGGARTQGEAQAQASRALERVCKEVVAR